MKRGRQIRARHPTRKSARRRHGVRDIDPDVVVRHEGNSSPARTSMLSAPAARRANNGPHRRSRPRLPEMGADHRPRRRKSCLIASAVGLACRRRGQSVAAGRRSASAPEEQASPLRLRPGGQAMIEQAWDEYRGLGQTEGGRARGRRRGVGRRLRFDRGFLGRLGLVAPGCLLGIFHVVEDRRLHRRTIGGLRVRPVFLASNARAKLIRTSYCWAARSAAFGSSISRLQVRVAAR